MRAKYARKIRFAIRMARATFWFDPNRDPYRSANAWFPIENPFCRPEHFAFLRTYQALQRKARTQWQG